NYADSLIFRDAELSSPSALQVVGNDIYVTNQGDSIPLVISLEGFFAGLPGFGGDNLGSVTNLDSIDAARLSVIATVLAGSSSEDGDVAEDENAADSFVVGSNVGLLGSVNLLSLLFAQSGVDETPDETAEDAAEEMEVPEWLEFVVGLQKALENFRAQLLAGNPELAGVDLIDQALAQAGLWLAETAFELDGWLAAFAPQQVDPLATGAAQVLGAPPQAAAVSVVAIAGASQTDDHPVAQISDATTDTHASELPGGLWRLAADWWSALTAATIASSAWFVWRRRRSEEGKFRANTSSGVRE
ncbi:MAG: hypothetical protein AB7K24_31390, partial [Gemmataceae bacterium]